jgi:hypothetical protein
VLYAYDPEGLMTRSWSAAFQISKLAALLFGFAWMEIFSLFYYPLEWDSLEEDNVLENR